LSWNKQAAEKFAAKADKAVKMANENWTKLNK